MKKLGKSILNYYATFTETRFNFRTLVNYQWSDDELTLDLGIFPKLQSRLINNIFEGDQKNIRIEKGEYKISLDDKLISTSLMYAFKNNYSLDYLKTCIKKSENKIKKTLESKVLIASESSGEIKPKPLVEKEFLTKAMKEGFRQFNLAIRKKLKEILLKLHEDELSQLKENYNIKNFPNSSFNSYDLIQSVFDELQKYATHASSAEIYFNKIINYFEKKEWNVILYDLYFILSKFKGFISIGTLYLFFLEMKTKENEDNKKYPLYFQEVEFVFKKDSIFLKCPHKLLMINTPAINSCKFPTILTTPRAALLSNAGEYLKTTETFLQAYYGRSEPFIAETNFRKLVSDKQNYPDVSFRVGFQVIKTENKKILDYSELLALLELGKGKKFLEFIDNYIKGNVEDTTDEVYKKFSELYPKKTPKRYISNNPLPLNLQQKRIITATANSKNKVIVIDGPPGTGKSHTIAALTYWANQNNKSVVITSHKKQALDVVDGLLTKEFKKLHPKAKPSLIRFTKNGKNHLNLPENTLSGAAINTATNRFHQFNQLGLNKDKEETAELLNQLLKKKLGNNDFYKNLITKLIAYEKIKIELLDRKLVNENQLDLIKKPFSKDSNVNLELFEFKDISDVFAKLRGININQLKLLIDEKSALPKIKEACENLNQLDTEILKYKPTTKTIPEQFTSFIQKAESIFKADLPLASLDTDIDSLVSPKSPFLKLFSKFIKNKTKPEEIKELLSEIKSLKYDSILSDIAVMFNVQKAKLTIAQVKNKIEDLKHLINAQKDLRLIRDFKEKLNIQYDNYSNLYKFVDSIAGFIDKITPEIMQSLFVLNNTYSSLLARIKISFEDLGTFFKLSNLNQDQKLLWQAIKLHIGLSVITKTDILQSFNANNLYKISQKLIENKNDERLKNLNNFSGDIQRSLIAIANGKRLKETEAEILLNNISCIIAGPELISRHFPMKEDMIDLLIIDESSQVSIAESISLILRAKQVIVFGDELQYGAVGAFNVSSKYSKSYFKEIIDSYSQEYNDPVSDGTSESILKEVGKEVSEDDREVEQVLSPKSEATQIWLKTFDIRTSTLNFCKAISNYRDSLTTHFRSFNEIIDYSNEFFYKPSQMPLVVNRIRTKPINKVLRFIKVETKGHSGNNVNLDEIEAIKDDIKKLIKTGFKGTIGIIASFKNQADRIEEILHRELPNFHKLKQNHKLVVWFVGDVQGEERDIVYYSFVQDKKLDNANLRAIYPVIGGVADDIRKLKMQRLNVGFSRAKDTMVFVHSMPIPDYSKTRLGDALKYYQEILKNTKDDILVDIEKLESPAEKDLYQLLIQTRFVKENKEKIKIIPQFKIGKYIKEEFHRNIPKYRVDLLLTLSEGGKEKALILEYDGIEYHTKNPDIVTAENITQEYLDYDINRQIELESYGYRFLRINKFTLLSEKEKETKVEVLNRLIKNSFKESN